MTSWVAGSQVCKDKVRGGPTPLVLALSMHLLLLCCIGVVVFVECQLYKPIRGEAPWRSPCSAVD
jgi:hypothetical protein